VSDGEYKVAEPGRLLEEADGGMENGASEMLVRMMVCVWEADN